MKISWLFCGRIELTSFLSHGSSTSQVVLRSVRVPCLHTAVVRSEGLEVGHEDSVLVCCPGGCSSGTARRGVAGDPV